MDPVESELHTQQALPLITTPITCRASLTLFLLHGHTKLLHGHGTAPQRVRVFTSAKAEADSSFELGTARRATARDLVRAEFGFVRRCTDGRRREPSREHPVQGRATTREQ